MSKWYLRELSVLGLSAHLMMTKTRSYALPTRSSAPIPIPPSPSTKAINKTPKFIQLKILCTRSGKAISFRSVSRKFLKCCLYIF